MTPHPHPVHHADEPEEIGSVIELHTLGNALIKVGEKEIRPTAPLLFAALLYLGMERGRRVPRAALQELLFPEVSERSGAHSLRQLLYKLRQLGVPLDSDATSVGIRTSDVVLDDSREASLTNGNGKNVERYAFGFLPSYHSRVSPAYETWLDQTRASVESHSRRLLVAAISASRETLQWPDVERLAKVTLQLDPFNEAATFALAEATAMSGAKTEAVAMLARYERETGRRDLQMPASLLRRRISERVPDFPKRTLEMPFVGREPDVEVVRRQMLLARHGQPSLLIIAGEPGIGKTRLLEETASLASLEGMRVHIVRCQPHYSSRPLSAFIELVPPLLSSRGALGITPQSLAHLKLLVSHAEDDDDNHSLDARDSATRSDILLTSLRDLVDAVSTEIPLLIGVEDAHWADADSLRELRALAGGSAHRSLLVILTTRLLDSSRHDESTGDSPVVRKLKPLPESRMGDLVAHLLPDNVTEGALDDVSSWCVQTAAGNPFFLRMLCAHYLETRQPFSIPPDLVSTTTRRIEQLPRECRRILEFCALLGSHATVDALRSLMECSQLQLLDAVQRLEDDGYLERRGDGIGTSHHLLSDATLELLPPIARQMLHASVAAHLEGRYDISRDASLLWDCAEHWSLSGHNDKALHFIKRCANHAMQIGRAVQALELLERAMAFAKHPKEVADLKNNMMLAATASGQWQDVYELSREVAVLSDAEAAPTRHNEQELRSIESQWTVHTEGGDAVHRLLNCIHSETADATHRVDAACVLMRIAHERCEIELAHRAYRAIDRLIDPRSPKYSHRILPLIYHTTFGDRDFALITARTLANDLELFDDGQQLRAGINVGRAFCFLGAREEGLELFAGCYRKAAHLGLALRQVEACINMCWAYAMVEDFANASPWHERAAQHIAGSQDNPPHVALLHLGNGIDLAIAARDEVLGRKLLGSIVRSLRGSLRYEAFYKNAETRLDQLDPSFKCDDHALEELRRLYQAVKRIFDGDSIALALTEALRRRGLVREAWEILNEYFTVSRREWSPIPPSLLQLQALFGDDS